MSCNRVSEHFGHSIHDDITWALPLSSQFYCKKKSYPNDQTKSTLFNAQSSFANAYFKRITSVVELYAILSWTYQFDDVRVPNINWTVKYVKNSYVFSLHF